MGMRTMDQVPGRKPPPASTDADRWRDAIADGSVATFRVEALVAAFQDLGPSADAVRKAIAKQLSDRMLRILRHFVGVNNPNGGDDIIYRVHGQLFEAMLQPASADGQALRAGFTSIVSFRVKDAIATENSHSRIPVWVRIKNAGKDRTHTDVVTLVPANDPDHSEGEADAIDGEEAQARSLSRDPALLDGVRDTDQTIDVERILALIPDDRKRLALRLYMDGFPAGSKKGDSIARAVGVTPKTVAQWVEEVQTLLQSNKEVQDLRKLSVGDNT